MKGSLKVFWIWISRKPCLRIRWVRTRIEIFRIFCDQCKSSLQIFVSKVYIMLSLLAFLFEILVDLRSVIKYTILYLIVTMYIIFFFWLKPGKKSDNSNSFGRKQIGRKNQLNLFMTINRLITWSILNLHIIPI